jgi:hypothetical protein
MNTGSSVVALTNRASCGRQNSTVANQSPSIVVDAVSGSLGEPTRSRNLRVPRMMTMTAFYPAAATSVDPGPMSFGGLLPLRSCSRLVRANTTLSSSSADED